MGVSLLAVKTGLLLAKKSNVLPELQDLVSVLFILLTLRGLVIGTDLPGECLDTCDHREYTFVDTIGQTDLVQCQHSDV